MSDPLSQIDVWLQEADDLLKNLRHEQRDEPDPARHQRRETRVAELLRDIARAEEEWMRLSPEVPPAHGYHYLAERHHAAGNDDAALQALDSAIAVANTKEQPLAELHVDRAALLAKQGQWFEALREYDAALRLSPTPEIVLERAIILFQQSPLQAEDELMKAARLAQEQGHNHTTFKAQLYYALVRHRQAAAGRINPHGLESIYATALELGEQVADLATLALVHLNQANLLRDHGSSQVQLRALDHYRKALLYAPNNADIHHELARFYRNQEQFEQANLAFQHAASLAPGRGDIAVNWATLRLRLRDITGALELYEQAQGMGWRDATLHIGLGTCALALGEIERASEQFRLATDIDPNDGIAWGNRGAIAFSQEAHEDARRFYNQAILVGASEVETAWHLALQGTRLQGALAEVLNQFMRGSRRTWYDPAEYASAHLLVRTLYDETEAAAALLERADNERDSLSRWYWNNAVRLLQYESMTLVDLGIDTFRSGNIIAATQQFEQALTIRHRIGDRRGETIILHNLGDMYFQMGNRSTAVAYYDQALAISRQIGDQRGEGNHLSSIGNVYAQLGEAHTAVTYYRQALTISRQTGDPRSAGSNLGNLGNAYIQLGEVRTAIDYYEQALTISRQIDDRRNEGATLGNLGNAYFRLGTVRTAINYYEQALAIRRQIGDRRGEGTDLGNLGIVYAKLGEVRTAVQHTLVATLIKHAIEDPSIATTMQLLAAQCQMLGRAPFEHLVREVCAAQDLDHDHCLHLLEAYHVFAGLPLSEQHQRLILAVAHAAQGVAAAQQAVQQWLDRRRTVPDWHKFVPVVERLLAGERDPAVLLAPENQLDGIDRTIIEAVLRGLQEPGGLAALETELRAATDQTPTLNEALREAAVVLGVALAGNPQAQEAIKEQLLPHMDRSADFQNLAAVVRRMLAGEHDEAALLDPANGLDVVDRLFVQLALASASRPSTDEQ